MTTSPDPSLLDWLNAHLARAAVRRAVCFGSALLAALIGLYLTAGHDDPGGYVFLLAASWLAVKGLRARNAAAAIPAGLPRLALGSAAVSSRAAAEAAETPAASLSDWVAALRLPAVIALAIVGQMILNQRDETWRWGLGLFVMALIGLAWVVRREGLLPAAPEVSHADQVVISPRLIWLAVVLIAAPVAYFGASDKQFTPYGVAAWIAASLAWLAALWEGTPRAALDRAAAWLQTAWRERAFSLRVTGGALLFLAVLAVGGYFRFAQLDAIPPEMTSDHVEKLLDVGDVVIGGQPILFFERNTGREPMQFYLAAWVIALFKTGLTHLTLKITTAAAGFVMLPFIFLIGRELEDDALGLIAMLLAAVAFWATAISRVGLRFPLSPLFLAPMFYFLLRGLRRGTRNDFLLAGLALGLGLYGYSPIRVAPIAVVAAVAWAALFIVRDRAARPALARRLGRLFVNTVLFFATVLIVFLPLLRYATETEVGRDMFWYRTVSRVAESENQLTNSNLARQIARDWAQGHNGEAISTPMLQLMLFAHNNWDALRMFNWQGDQVWVNALPGQPVLDLVTGALWILGLGYGLHRLIARRDWRLGLLILLIPILMLPSTLSLAYPDENPSVVRVAGAIPIFFVLAAYPLWLLIRRAGLSALGGWAAGATLVVTLGLTAQINHDRYFRLYPAQYLGAAQNASEIGELIFDYARVLGSTDTAFVRPFPHWVDTRAVGMYARDFGRDYAIEFDDLGRLAGDPRPKLFILNALDVDVRPDGVAPTLPELRRLYPSGIVSTYRSASPGKDFLVYFVPIGAVGETEPVSP